MAPVDLDGATPVIVLDDDDQVDDKAAAGNPKMTPPATPSPVQQAQLSVVPAAAAQASAGSAALPSIQPAGGSNNDSRQSLTEAQKKEALRLRNRESARRNSLRRKAQTAALEKQVVELTAEKENLRKEKDMWMEKYVTLLENQQQEARMSQQAPPVAVAMDAGPSQPLPSFLYRVPPPAPFTWGPLQVAAAAGAAAGAGQRRLPQLAWYYPAMQAAATGAPLPTQEPPTSGNREEDPNNAAN